jgi:hypothetical protein
MRRNTINFVIDLAALLVMLALAATGLIMRFALPPGSGGRGGGLRATLWGWGRHDWGDLHLWLSIAVGALLLIHAALHWDWLCCTARKLMPKEPGATDKTRTWMRNLVGAGALGVTAALLTGFTWFTSAQVTNTRAGGLFASMHGQRAEIDAASIVATPSTQPDPARRGHDRNDRGSCGDGRKPEHQTIRGSMSLADVAAGTGIPAETIRADLKLPDSAPLNERLGRLCRQYGLEMSQVRQAVPMRAN